MELSAETVPEYDFLRGLAAEKWRYDYAGKNVIHIDAFDPKSSSDLSTVFDDPNREGRRALHGEKNASRFGAALVDRHMFDGARARLTMPALDWDKKPHRWHVALVFDKEWPPDVRRRVIAALADCSTFVPRDELQ